MKYIDFSLCLDYFICNGNNLHLQSQFLFIIKTIDSYPVTPVISPCQLVFLTKRQKIIAIQTIVVLGFAIHSPLRSEPDKF